METHFRKLIAAIALAAALPFYTIAQHTGRVFIDSNNNGQYDPGEKGMRGVAVSDGLHVVQTDANGTFTLPGYSGERFITVTTPSGYYAPLGYYYPIDPVTGNYNFALRPIPGKISSRGEHAFIQITDTEIFNTEGNELWVNELREYANNEQAAFIIHTGDICYEKGMQEHIQLMNTGNMGRPVYYCIGNHDLVAGPYGEALFESIYGPVYYSFDAGNIHYIVTPMPSGDYVPSYTQEQVAAWLRNDLALVPAGKAVVMFNHDLLSKEDKFLFPADSPDPIDLSRHNLTAWLFGHWHINYMKQMGDVLAIGTGTVDKGGIDHSTSAYRMLRVDGKGKLNSDLRYSYIAPMVEIASVNGNTTPVLPGGNVPLIVNSYASTTHTANITYSCRIDSNTRIKNRPLTRQTDWSWHTTIPLNSKDTGKQVDITVEACFTDGSTVTTTASFLYHGYVAGQLPFEGDWCNLLGNPQHTGGIVSTTGSGTPSLAWVTNTGNNLYMSSPLIRQEHVYVASVDENLKGEAFVYCFDGHTGTIRWKYPVRNSIKNSIAADNGLIFAQDVEGYLYAIDARTGSLRWEKKLAVGYLPALIEGVVTSNGVVYAGTGKGLGAFCCETGEQRWNNSGWSQAEGTTSTLSVGNDVLLSGAQWRGLYANELSTGKLVWTQAAHGLNNRGASAAMYNGLIYIISGNSFFILNTANGEIIVRKELPCSVDVTSTPLLTDSKIIFGTADQGVMALNRETLEVEWTFATQPALVYTAPYTRYPFATVETSPVLWGGRVYIGASDGTLYGLNPETGEKEWSHTTGAPLFGTVALSGGVMIATDFAGNVYGFTIL